MRVEAWETNWMALEVVKERENRGDEQLDNILWLIWMWNVGEK